MTPVSNGADLERLRAALGRTAECTRRKLMSIIRDPHLFTRLKFEPLGCDPLDEADAQNVAEQIDQHATHEVALDALEELMRQFPGHTWRLAAGARGSGHDVTSTDRLIAAEIFCAVRPTNNRKLDKDIAKVRRFAGPHRFVFYRSLDPPSRRVRRGVEVISLGPPQLTETDWCIEVAARRGRRQWRRVSRYFKLARALKAARNRRHKDPDRVYRLRHRFTDSIIMADLLR